MTVFRAMIADDEPPGRRKLRRLLDAHPDIRVEGEAGTGNEAVEVLRRCRPDVVFLDVQMPGLDGFQVLEALGDLPATAVIFVTAYQEYAVKAFEVEAFDYLLKPVTAERLAAALDRLRKHRNSAGPAGDLQPYLKRILVRGVRVARFVTPAEIDWIEADRNYLILHCGAEEHLVRATLEAFAARLDPAEFARVNRSTIVNLGRVRELQLATHGEYRLVLASGHELTWSRRFVSPALERFVP